MRCARCGWPSDDAEVLSTHRTSQGWVRYRRCVCGDHTIELVTLDPTAGAQVEPVHEPAEGVPSRLVSPSGDEQARPDPRGAPAGDGVDWAPPHPGSRGGAATAPW